VFEKGQSLKDELFSRMLGIGISDLVTISKLQK
jgi:hypothetical protein